MRELMALLAPVLAFAVAWGVTRVCCRPGPGCISSISPMRVPCTSRPRPRTGGVGVMAGLLAEACWWGWRSGDLPRGRPGGCGEGWPWVGLADDRVGLSARLRLLAQVLVAGKYLALLGTSGAWLEVLARA
ncbi:hypothetical protein [Zoogloea sp.]|uniref:hypothetical protein n=1 Tax=Zoogloea sp. TaxID=49181 RepID=UPI001DE34516|nr:hypothetical protein [Zoogloea sp.]MBK6653034.1 hypothetical protein [Zoogloea sp.]